MGQAQFTADAFFQNKGFLAIALKQRQQVDLRPDSALDPSRRVGLHKGIQSLEGVLKVFAKHGQALAKGRSLGCDVVRPCSYDLAAVLLGLRSKGQKGCHRFKADDF